MNNVRYLNQEQDKSSFYYGIGNLLFYTGISSLVFTKFLGLNFSDNLYKLATLFSLFCFFIKFIDTKYNRKELVKIIIIGFVAIAFFAISHRPALPMTLLILICSKAINKKVFINIFFYSSLIAFILILCLCLFRFIPNIEITMDRLSATGISQITRYSLGYYHPNITYIYFFIICSLYILKNKNIINYIHLLIILFLSIILYFFTLSRTGLICTIVLIFLCFIYLLRISLPKAILKFFVYSPIIIGICIVILSIFYTENNIIMSTINKLMSGRLYYNKLFLTPHYLSLFGTNMNILSEAETFLDSGFILLLISHGLIFYIIFLYSSFLILKKHQKNKYINIFTCILFSINIYCITEFFLSTILINFILIYYNYLIFDENILIKPINKENEE